VETGEHLARCLVYIDLNMVRAGVVGHPRDWEVSGYREIQSPPLRYRVIDRVALAEVLGVSRPEALSRLHRGWVDVALQSPAGREDIWTRSLAVGSEAFVRQVQQELGVRGVARDLEVSEEQACVREGQVAYEVLFGG
jgi:putative transposase